MSKQVNVYPPEEMVRDWDQDRQDLNMSRSEYIQRMVCAGQKKFDSSQVSDESKREIRQERNDLKDKLSSAREEINDLESRAYGSEKEEIVQKICEDPGANLDDLVLHLSQDLPGRVSDHLSDLVGTRIERRDGQYYPANYFE